MACGENSSGQNIIFFLAGRGTILTFSSQQLLARNDPMSPLLRLSRVSTFSNMVRSWVSTGGLAGQVIEKLASDTLVRLGYVLVEAFEVKEMYPGVETQESQRSGLLPDIMTFSRHGEEFVHFGENLYFLVKWHWPQWGKIWSNSSPVCPGEENFFIFSHQQSPSETWVEFFSHRDLALSQTLSNRRGLDCTSIM